MRVSLNVLCIVCPQPNGVCCHGWRTAAPTLCSVAMQMYYLPPTQKKNMPGYIKMCQPHQLVKRSLTHVCHASVTEKTVITSGAAISLRSVCKRVFLTAIGPSYITVGSLGSFDSEIADIDRAVHQMSAVCQFPGTTTGIRFRIKCYFLQTKQFSYISFELGNTPFSYD